MKFPNEQFQYIEFASNNLTAIRAFYEHAFAWEFTDYGEDYTAFSGDYVDGGFYPGTPQMGSILPVLYAHNLETTQEKVRAAGGHIVKEIFSFPGGRRFHFTDPDTNEIAVWSDT